MCAFSLSPSPPSTTNEQYNIRLAHSSSIRSCTFCQARFTGATCDTVNCKSMRTRWSWRILRNASSRQCCAWADFWTGLFWSADLSFFHFECPPILARDHASEEHLQKVRVLLPRIVSLAHVGLAPFTTMFSRVFSFPSFTHFTTWTIIHRPSPCVSNIRSNIRRKFDVHHRHPQVQPVVPLDLCRYLARACCFSP